jgi:hypothetical protein
MLQREPGDHSGIQLVIGAGGFLPEKCQAEFKQALCFWKVKDLRIPGGYEPGSTTPGNPE